jgi:parvulin-like peptidyl-prolyl isomerase
MNSTLKTLQQPTEKEKIMSVNIEINNEDILNQIKLSCKLPEIAEQIINKRIIEAEAEKMGVIIEPSELQLAADNFRIKQRLSSAKITQMWLGIHSLSLDDFEEIIRLELLESKVKELLFKDEIEKYFYEHQSDFDEIILYELILKSKELVDELYYAIREGEISFQEVVNKYIDDKELKRKGGFLGKIRRKDMRPELLLAFSVSTTPQVVKPICTSRGFHLILVEEIIKSELDIKNYEEIREQLFINFLRNKISNLFSTAAS